MRSRNEKKIGMTSTDIKLDLICFFFGTLLEVEYFCLKLYLENYS